MVTDGLTEARRSKNFLGLDGLGVLARQALAAPTPASSWRIL